MKEALLQKLWPSRKKKKKSKIEETPRRAGVFSTHMTASTYRTGACLILAGIITLLIAPRLTTPRYTYDPGDIAKHTVRAPRDFSVEDSTSTEKKKAQAAEEVLSVYDFNSRAAQELEKRITEAFSFMRNAIESLSQGKSVSEEKKEEFQNILQIRVPDDYYTLLLKNGFDKETEGHLLDLTLPYARREIVASTEQLFKERGRGIMLRDIYTKEEIFIDDLSSLIDIEELEIMLRRDARKILGKMRPSLRNTITGLAVKLLEPTITFNPVETNKRRHEAITNVNPLYYNVKKDEIIVREGSRINEETALKLKALKSMKRRRNLVLILAGYFLLSFVSLHVLYRFTIENMSNGSFFRINSRDLLFLCSLFAVTFIALKLCFFIADGISKGYEEIPLDCYLYGIPFAFAAMVISVVLSPRIAALSSIIIAMFVCFMLESRFGFFMYALISSLVAAQEVTQTKERKMIIRAGLIVGGVNTMLIISLYLIAGNIFSTDPLISIGFGVLGGLLSAVLATGIVPIVEIAFNYTTDIKLLELADLNQPVLRKLLISAPGTYHHSILVGILAESAAEAINANSLLARVSSYYHDIGKIKKPQYFVENQKGIENKHDKLLPSMSSLIITSHVKEGCELAKAYHLGKPIQDIISQHHGTRCIDYFYQKAKSLHEGTGQPVSDKDFRYPGPKPQTKEAGIVMLADAIQATSKTLAEPSPARIQGMVQRIINNIFADGQLDECELTLKDLHLIAESCIRILNGFFHSRIDYFEKVSKEQHGKGTDKKPAKADADTPARDSKDSDRDLGKRIGITKSRNKHSAAG